jgi:16S rRNA G966 N2-methylase RsmD
MGMNQQDAEEFTQSLGQIVAGSWRQVALAKRLGVPQALGLSVEDWVNDRLGGYVKMSIPERREAVKELVSAGHSVPDAAEIVGVERTTAWRDVANATPPPKPIDAVAALAATEQVRKTAERNERREQLKEEKSKPRPGVTKGDFLLLNCDINDASIQDGSVDWIITDPPYPKEFVGLYADLAKRASQWLRPGGSLIAMAGQSHVPEVMKALLSAGLKYHWALAYLTPGGQSVQVFPRRVNTFWKPVFWFVNGEYDGQWIGDVAKSDTNDNDKRFHEWGQSESGFADLIARFTRPGDMICDPFMGGGTTGAVALTLDRNFIGIEKDASVFATAKRRLAEVANATMVG